MFLTFKTLSKSSNILQDLIKAISNLPFEFCHMTTGFSGKRMRQTIDPPFDCPALTFNFAAFDYLLFVTEPIYQTLSHEIQSKLFPSLPDKLMSNSQDRNFPQPFHDPSKSNKNFPSLCWNHVVSFIKWRHFSTANLIFKSAACLWGASNLD